jgi:hypothetical protein
MGIQCNALSGVSIGGGQTEIGVLTAESSSLTNQLLSLSEFAMSTGRE